MEGEFGYGGFGGGGIVKFWGRVVEVLLAIALVL